MAGELDIDTTSDSDSESECDTESSTGSDSLSEDNSAEEVKQGNKRKMTKRNCKQKETSSPSTTKKRQAEDSSLYFRQKFGNKSELPVTCGNKDGVLHVKKYNDMEKCIFSEDQWFKPNEFEKFGGKERSKKWKTSIFCDNIPLQKLIETGLLSSFKQSRVKNEQTDSPESSPVADRLRKRKRQRLLFPSCSEMSGNDEDNGKVVDESDEDITDMTVFEGPTLPITCGSNSGILHKYRFATGRCGRCIRTKDFWLTPEDFIRVSKPEGTWRKDILSNGVPLGKLIMKSVLDLHMTNCECTNCKDLDQYQQNDDVCFVCDSEGDLVCCDECPRAFHSHCHLPAVNGDSPGSQWSCTFCEMKKMESSSQKSQQDVLSSPVSQYTLHDLKAEGSIQEGI